MVTEWNTEAAALIVDKTVKGYLPFRAQIEQQCRVHFKHPDLFRTAAVMQFLWDPSGGLVVSAILLVAPVQCGPVQVCNIPEDPSNKEVLLYEANQALYLALGKRMPRLAELCLEAHCFHKGLVVLLPDRMALKVPVEDHTFHIVR